MTRNTVSTHAAGVTAALFLFLGIMHEELELRFFPVITNVQTRFISRDAETVRFSFDFDKVRAGGRVQNSWWVDAPGNVGRYFQTPVRCLELRYNGYSRVVEVHAVGLFSEGNSLMRVWQVRGGSVQNEPVGWKLMRLDEGFSAFVTNEKSMAPRPGYKRGDPAMRGGIESQL